MPVNVPLRVLMTADTVGGVWTFATELCAGLIEQGAQVQLAALGPSISPDQGRHADSIRGLRWVHRASTLEWMDDPWDEVNAARTWLESLAREFRPDVVHLNTLSYGDAGFGVPVVQTVHSCVCSWWEAVKHSPLPAEWNRYRGHVEASLQAATLLTAPSSAALSDVARHYRVDVLGATSIFNGVDQTDWGPAYPEPFIFSAGRLWDEAKNLAALADISERLTWPIYLAGNPISPTGATAVFRNCRLLGELDRRELPEWYSRASVYAAPAKYEPFGLSILEAALSGCALVLGDIPSLREIWENAAIFAAPDDHKALLAAIESLIADKDQRQLMTDRALARAADFSSSRMTAKYLTVYRAAVQRGIRGLACAS
ncbi:MAG TPA: glycosyltransferase family 4 protein [Bryobacteraceae bacterium]|jgi:glycosyltransferase involved in cell wall biosynthesis|nr:glycosyltransferase family 4 protein [Bryobacteraceae bacterium]